MIVYEKDRLIKSNVARAEGLLRRYRAGEEIQPDEMAWLVSYAVPVVTAACVILDDVRRWSGGNYDKRRVLEGALGAWAQKQGTI